MALADIVAKIEQDAKAEVEKILEEAELKAKAESEAIEKDKQKQLAGIEEKGKKDARLEHKRAISITNLDIRKSNLSIKQEAVDKVLEQALERLAKLPAEEYFRTVERLIGSIDIHGEVELILRPEDKARIPNDFLAQVNQKLGGKATVSLSQETRAMHGGFVLRSGRKEENLIFAALIREMRQEIQAQLAKILFKDGSN